MDINQSSLSRSKLNKPGIARSAAENRAVAEALKSKDAVSPQNVSGTKQLELKEGQVVQGEILDHRYNEVRIQLEPSKQVVTAKLTGDVPLSIGQKAEFQVTEDSLDHLVLKYIPATITATDSTIQKALTASGLPMTERNRAIVEELLNHTMPVDKQTLQSLIKFSHTNRESSPLTLVLMYKNNIPMTAANIRQFEAYQNGTSQLLKGIQSITTNISELLHQTNEPLQEVLHLNNKLIDILYGNAADASAATLTTPINHVLNPEGLALLSNTLDQKLANDTSLASGLPSELNSSLMAQLKDGSMTLEEAATVIAKLYPEQTEELLSLRANVMLAETYVELQNTQMPDIFKPLLDQFFLAKDSQVAISQVLNPLERASIAELFQSFPNSESFRSKVMEDSANVRDIIAFLQNNLPQVEEMTAQKLLTSPEYQTLLKGAFQEKWTLTPEKLAKKFPVNELYRNLQEDMEQLSSLSKLEQSTNDASRLQEPVKNMQENLRFMRDLNEMFTFLPLPMQLKEQGVHSDLYVFTRKNSLQGKKDISVLLHLDMTNLGSMNVHIRMDHNSIQAKFYMEDPVSEHLVAEYLPTLSQALTKKGYSLHSEVMGSYEKPDFSKDFIEDSAIDSEVRRYTFDIRT